MQRGEVWMVDMEPTRGSEMRKVRPVAIVNRDDMNALDLRVIVPFTTWQGHVARWPWMVEVLPTAGNGLRNRSLANCFQVRCLAGERFQRRLGALAASDLQAIAEKLAEVIGYL